MKPFLRAEVIEVLYIPGKEQCSERDVLLLDGGGIGLSLLLRLLVAAGLGRRHRTDGIPLPPGRN